MIDYKKVLLDLIHDLGDCECSLPECLVDDIEAAKYLFSTEFIPDYDNDDEIYPEFYYEFSEEVRSHPEIKAIILKRNEYRKKYYFEQHKKMIKELLTKRKELETKMTEEKQKELFEIYGKQEYKNNHVYSINTAESNYIHNLKAENLYITKAAKLKKEFDELLEKLSK